MILDWFIYGLNIDTMVPKTFPKYKSLCHLGLHFLIDFWSIFLPNLDPQFMKNRAPAIARAGFMKNRLSS